MAAPRTVDGYVRVSRVGGREGESFISPEVQRKKIEAWAGLHEVEVVQWWEELDQSGAKRDAADVSGGVARCERGETGGIVVARLDRFARSAVDALESIKRLNEAGARLVSVEDNFDGSTAMGRFAIGILTLIAELELERIKENWSTAVREAVGRGVHISATCLLPATSATRRSGSSASSRPRSRSRGIPPPRPRRLLARARRLPERERCPFLATGQRALVFDRDVSRVKNPVYLGRGAQRQRRESRGT